jgi:hypothetical protein
MKKPGREKMLFFALLGVLALWQGQSLFHVLFIAPKEARQARLEALKKSVRAKELEKKRLNDAQLNLKTWETRSLPPVPVVAQSQYQPWLIELATQSKLTGVSVDGLTGTPPVKGGTYYSIPATLKARGTLDRVCDFLYAFHQAGFLHRVTGLTLETAKHEGNPQLDVVIQIEGLSLINSPARTTLLADPNAPPKPRQPLKDRKEFDAITTKNLFVSTYKPKPPEKPVEKPKSVPELLPDTAEFVYLVASVASGSDRDATLHDRTSNKLTRLTPGGNFSIAGVAGKIVSINDDHVVVEVQGENWQLDLGKNLRQMRKP